MSSASKNLRYHVLRRDEVNVMAADALQPQHDRRELGRRDFDAIALLARFKVLTEHAPQIAPREKDRPRAVPATQTILLSEVCERASHPRKPPAFAYAGLVFQPIYLAIARADVTATQQLKRLFHFLAQPSFLVSFHVGRNEFTAGNHKPPLSRQFKRDCTAPPDILAYKLEQLWVPRDTARILAEISRDASDRGDLGCR